MLTRHGGCQGGALPGQRRQLRAVVGRSSRPVHPQHRRARSSTIWGKRRVRPRPRAGQPHRLTGRRRPGCQRHRPGHPSRHAPRHPVQRERRVHRRPDGPRIGPLRSRGAMNANSAPSGPSPRRPTRSRCRTAWGAFDRHRPAINRNLICEKKHRKKRFRPHRTCSRKSVVALLICHIRRSVGKVSPGRLIGRWCRLRC